MTSLDLIAMALTLGLAILGVKTMLIKPRRTPEDVLAELQSGTELDPAAPPRSLRVGQTKLSLNDNLSRMGLYGEQERARYRKIHTLLPIAILLVGLVGLAILQPTSAFQYIALATVTFAIAAVVQGRFERATKESYLRSIEFYLPIVMERLIMAVQTGHDVLSAVRTVIEIEETTQRTRGVKEDDIKFDPVTRLLSIVNSFALAGIQFGSALKLVSSSVESPAIRHAFLHLGLAFAEGGALVTPLKELSDSTQLYYQESTEEQIAKLPGKALLPLMVIFLGLMSSFLAGPLTEVSEITKQVVARD